ncbi:MAG: type I toxin-antitoxin system Fst family toxin [Lactobacillus sp.]
MFKDLFQAIIAPLVVGIVLALFNDWLDHRHDR